MLSSHGGSAKLGEGSHDRNRSPERRSSKVQLRVSRRDVGPAVHHSQDQHVGPDDVLDDHEDDVTATHHVSRGGDDDDEDDYGYDYEDSHSYGGRGRGLRTRSSYGGYPRNLG